MLIVGVKAHPAALTNFDDSKNFILKPTNKVLINVKVDD